MKKSKIDKLNEKIEGLLAELEIANEEVAQARLELLRCQRMNMDLQEKVNLAEIEARGALNREIRLNFTAIKGHYPILWVNFEKSGFNHKSSATLHDAIKRHAPDVDLVLFTEGKASLQEISDKDLNDMGLARITGYLNNQYVKKLIS